MSEDEIKKLALDSLVYHNGKKETVITACNMCIDSVLESAERKEQAKLIKEWIIINK